MIAKTSNNKNVNQIKTFIIILLCCVCTSVHAQQGSILYQLPLFERAVLVIKHFEGLHRLKDKPYMGYGHLTQAGEQYQPNMTEAQAEQLLRKDLKALCARFRYLGKDSLLCATIAYNVGYSRILGYGKWKKSELIHKLERGDRNVYREYMQYCHVKGKRIASIARRRQVEWTLLYIE